MRGMTLAAVRVLWDVHLRTLRVLAFGVMSEKMLAVDRLRGDLLRRMLQLAVAEINI